MIVAGFASWHEAHDVARRTLDGGPRLIAHCALEAYSVLTRLPPPHRVRPEVVHDFLSARFPKPALGLSPREHGNLVRRMVDLRVTGGAVYDAFIAVVAICGGATLLTLDRRATTTYQLLGARFEQLVV